MVRNAGFKSESDERVHVNKDLIDETSTQSAFGSIDIETEKISASSCKFRN